MENDRRLFSRKDGKTFREDFPTFYGEVRRMVAGLPDKIKEILPEVEDYVESIKALAAALQEGSPTDLAITKALEFIPGDKDLEIYFKAKLIITGFALRLATLLEYLKKTPVGDPMHGTMATIKREAATELIIRYHNGRISKKDVGLAIESVLFYTEYNA